MLRSVIDSHKEIRFLSKQSERQEQIEERSRILPDNAKTRIKQKNQKISSAIIDYPVKGLRGDVNSNFYEFLSMGIIPYLAGSAAFMFVFNAANKYLNLFEKEKASTYGKKMALGVVLYGLFKNISKNLVTKPVKHATGVNIDMPYENIVYALPTEAGENAQIEIQHQQRTVYDSKEFFRKDLLNKEYFDGVAKKLGLGSDLNDSVSEVTPIIQNIVATTNTAKSISSYLWAAVGVGMAVQDSWKDFFTQISNRNRFHGTKDTGFGKRCLEKSKNFCRNTWNIILSFCKSLVNSFVQMWNGAEGKKGFGKHAGKSLISIAVLTTAFLTSNAILRAKHMAKSNNNQTIDKTKESTVI